MPAHQLGVEPAAAAPAGQRAFLAAADFLVVFFAAFLAGAFLAPEAVFLATGSPSLPNRIARSRFTATVYCPLSHMRWHGQQLKQEKE